jgi:hypothetical protein
MVNIYAAKTGYAGDKRLAKYTLFAGCIAPFLYRLREGMSFSEYVVVGRRLPFSNLAVPAPPTPAFIIVVHRCPLQGLNSWAVWTALAKYRVEGFPHLFFSELMGSRFLEDRLCSRP